MIKNGISKKLLTTVSFLAISSAFSLQQAYGAAIIPAGASTTDVTGADTWDVNAGVGAVDANLRYNNGAGGASLVVTDSVGAGTGNIGTITLNTDAGAHLLTVGDGTNAVELIVNGAVSGDTAANDLSIIVDASGGAASSTLNFKSTVDLGSGTITLNASATDAILKFSGTAAQTVTGAINGAIANEGDISITNTHASGVTFASAVGGTAIDTITIGASSLAVFQNAANATNGITIGSSGTMQLNITGSGFTYTGAINGASSGVGTLDIAETGGQIATFASSIGGTNTLSAITIGSSSTAENTIALFNGNVSTTAITLGDTTNADTITAHFQTNTNGTSYTVAGTINEITSGTDTTNILISDLSAGTEDSVTFSGAIGATTAVDSLTIGDSANTIGGKGIFSSTVSATAIAIDASDTGDADASQGDFNAAVTGAVTLTGGDNAAEAASATFASDVTGAITLNDGTGLTSITFDGASTQTVSGAVAGSASGEGTVTVNNNVVFSSSVGATRLKALTLASSKTMTIGTSGSTTSLGATTTTINGTLKALDTIQLVNGSTVTFANGSSITVNDASVIASSDSVIDADTNSATIVIGSISTDTVTVNLPSSFRTGTINLIDANSGGTLTMNGSFSLADTSVTDYTLTNTSGLVTITAASQAASTIASNLGISIQQASALGAALEATASDATITAAYDTAIAAGGVSAKMAAESSAPDPATMSAVGVELANTGTTVAKIATEHLAMLRDDNTIYASKYNGVAAGDAPKDKSVWIKGFANFANQSEKQGIEGYGANTKGLVGGADFYKGDKTTAGMSVSYAHTDIKGESLIRSKTTIDSYQVSLYGDYTTDNWYVEALAAYARNDVHNERYLSFGGVSRTAIGDYVGNQYMGSIGGGAPLKVSRKTTFTPIAGFHYIMVHNEAYSEAGAGALNLNITTDKVNVAEFSLGAKADTSFDLSNGASIIPEIHARALYDVANDEAEVTSKFLTGGGSFVIKGADVEPLAGNAGAKLTYDSEDMALSAGYDGTIKKDYYAHTGIVEAKLKF